MLSISRFIFSPFQENTYLIYDDAYCEAAVIDPGCTSEAEENELAGFIQEKNLNIKYLINTHCHIDHIFGNAFVKGKYDPVFLAPERDLFLFDIMKEQASSFGVQMKDSPMPDELISEESPMTLGESQGRFLFTPGHSPGSHCLFFDKEKFCITGDVLFKEGIGRTDLWQGNYDELIKSIEEKLYVLPEETKIFPGHGEKSSIGYEKKHNPFVSQS